MVKHQYQDPSSLMLIQLEVKQVIDVRFANESNTQTSWIKLDVKLKDNESIMDYVIESIGKSSLVKSNKSIIVRNATGTGQEIVVK